MGNLGWTEMFFIVAFALIVFGPRKLPEIAKTLGHAVAQLRRASEEFKKTWEVEVDREIMVVDQKPAEQLDANEAEAVVNVTEAAVDPYADLIPGPEGTHPSTLLGSTESEIKSEENRPVPIA